MSCIIEFQGKSFTKEEFIEYAYKEHLNLEDPDVSKVFHQLSSDENTFYDSQAEGKTKKAKETLDRIKNLQKRVIFNEEDEDNPYVLENGQKLMRVSTFYQSQPGPQGEESYYKFEGDPSLYEDNRQWGNQLDTILRGVILDKTIDEVKEDLVDIYTKGLKKGSNARISDEAIAEAFAEFTKFKALYKNSILLTQVVLFNEEKNVAGSVDIMAIHPDGTISIIDLKTSLDFSKYKYQPANATRAFSKARHSAQLGAYKALAVSKGFTFDENRDLATYLMELKDIEDENIVNKVEDKGIVPIIGEKSIFNKLNKDNHFIDDSINPIEATTEFSLYIDEIKKLVKNKAEKAKKENKPGQEFVFNSLLRDLESSDDLKALALFIDDTYRQFLGADNWSLFTSVQKDVINIKKGKYDSAHAIGILHDRQQIIQLYLPIVSRLNDFYKKHYFTEQGIPIPVEVVEGSPLDKLKKVLSAAQDLKAQLNDTLIPLQAEILSEMASKDANTALEGETKRRLERYTKFKAETIRQNLDKNSDTYKRRLKREAYLKEQYDIIARNLTTTKESIEKELKEGALQDISVVDKLINPTISSQNSVLATFAKLLKSKIEDMRQELISFSRNTVEKFEDYAKKSGLNRDNVDQFNEGLYEEVRFSEDKSALSFVQPVDVTKYNKAKEVEWARIERLGLTDPESYKLKAEWYSKNRFVPEEDIKIGNTIVFPSIARVKEKMLKRLGKINYEDWESRNIFTSATGEVGYSTEILSKYSLPLLNKYANPKYAELKANEAKWSYYKYLVESYFKAQERLPEYAQKGFILPSIRKHANNFEKLKSSITSLAAGDNQDVNIYGDTTESSLKTIPILFTNYLDPKETSNDLISSVMLFEEASLRYDMRSAIAPLADTLLNTVKSTSPTKTDSQGYQVLDTAAKKLGLNSVASYIKKNGDNNIAGLLEAFIDVQIYGKNKEKSTVSLLGKEFDLGKVADTLMGLQAFTQIGGSPLLSVANTLQANALATFEAITGQYFSKGSWADAKSEYAKLLPSFLEDASNPINNSLIGQMTDLYDAMQGSYLNEYGREVSFSGKKKNLNYRAWYFLQHAGEHEIQVTTMIAKLKSTKVKQGNKEISLYDAYELDKAGKIKLKAGVTLNGNISVNGLMSKDIQFALHAINKRLHGVYNDFDRPTIERFWYGRLILMYRKFVAPGIMKRYKEVSIDQELGMITEGSYRTFFRVLFKEYQEMFKIGFGFGNTENSDLTDMELMNIRRTTLELGTFIMLGIMTILLESLRDSYDDDDKERWALSYPLYWAMRLQSELGFYSNPRDAIRLFKSPSVGYSLVDKSFDVFEQIVSPLETYKKSTGYADKGDYKFPYKSLKLFGVNGANVDPQIAIDNLTLSKQ